MNFFSGASLKNLTRFPVSIRNLLIFATCVVVVGNIQNPQLLAQRLSPENKDVKAAIEKGAKYLESASEGRLGGKALVALTLTKCGRKPDHPKVKEAIVAIQNAIKVGGDKFKGDIYSTGLSIMCLVAIDPSRYRFQIEELCKSLHVRQKQQGAWGYPTTHATHGLTGDTSMTQYAALGLWEAEDLAGVPTPIEVWQKLAAWVVLTQDPSGGFGYQGKRSTEAEKPVKQGGIRHSMSAAGMVAFYVCKDRLGISELKKSILDDTPKALRPYETLEDRKKRIKTKIPLKFFARVDGRGNRWHEQKAASVEVPSYQYYYLYALERYESLKEADKRGFFDIEAYPGWYQKGARFLLENQDKVDGFWNGQTKEVPSTCFAILFLLRSTQQNLKKSSARRFLAGQMQGGRNIPIAPRLRLREGKAVVEPTKEPPNELFKILANAKDARFSAGIEQLADLAEAGNADILINYPLQLTRLALNEDKETRAVAINAIGSSRNIELVPLLIYLLKDNSEQIANTSNEALKKISRNDVELKIGTPKDKSPRNSAIEQWKSWYQSIRPDVDVDAFDPDEVG